MHRIGLLSDTHGTLHPRILDFFASCHELWHAGDIGNVATADELSAFKPLKAVYGNIDGTELRVMYPKISVWVQTGLLIIHISHCINVILNFKNTSMLFAKLTEKAIFTMIFLNLTIT